jgi:hypothetical protein
MDCRAAWAGGDAGVSQYRHRLMLGEGSFECTQLSVDVSKGAELGDNQRIIALAEAVQIENESTEIAVGKLASLAQKASAAAHTSALTESRWPGRQGNVHRWAGGRCLKGGG